MGKWTLQSTVKKLRMITPDEAEEKGAWRMIEEELGKGGNERTPLLTMAVNATETRDSNAGDGDSNGVCVCIGICDGGWQSAEMVDNDNDEEMGTTMWAW